MALTIGGSGINNSMLGGVSSANNAGSNLGMYQNQNYALDENRNVDMENNGEDLMMMNIPREGNADQLNKSTKLTLSSKK